MVKKVINLLLVTLALSLQPGKDALGGVPAAKVHLKIKIKVKVEPIGVQKNFYCTSSPPMWNVVGLNISSQSLKANILKN